MVINKVNYKDYVFKVFFFSAFSKLWLIIIVVIIMSHRCLFIDINTIEVKNNRFFML